MTKYGSFKFLVMSFGLTNALATFCTLIDKVLQPFLDCFIVVYLDNIAMYNTALKEMPNTCDKFSKYYKKTNSTSK